MIIACLVVKDEAGTIRQTLDSIRDTLGPELSAIVVHDTGSSDGTPDICGEHGAVVFQVPWRDFSTNRNAVLESASTYAQPSDLLLMLDAGTILRGELGEPSGSAGAWTVTIKLGTITYQRPQIFKPRAGWHYEGRVHEAAVGPGPTGTSGLVVDYCLKDTARPERWQRDLALLEDDHTPRGRFYYAQTLELTSNRATAYFWYLHRGARTDGWYQERALAYIRAISLAPSYVSAKWCCSKALDADATRGEAWLELAKYGAACAASPQDWQAVSICAAEALAFAPAADALFVDTDREWRARELSARAAFYMGHKAAARAVWTDLLSVAPEYFMKQLIENIRFCDE